MASKVEEKLRRLTLETRLLEETAEALQSRINMTNTVMTDLTYSNMTLEGLEKNKIGSELLVPIGGGSYIKAKIHDLDNVIVGIGGGVSVEKTLQETKEVVKKRLESLEKTRSSLQTRFVQVAQKISENRGEFEGLASGLRKGNPSGNV